MKFVSNHVGCHALMHGTILRRLPQVKWVSGNDGGIQQGGIKYFTLWEPILSAKSFARNSSQTRQKVFKTAVIWVFNMWFTNLYLLYCISKNASLDF